MTCYENCTTDCGTCKGHYLPGKQLLDLPAPEHRIPGVAAYALGVVSFGEPPLRVGVQAGKTPREIWNGIAASFPEYELIGIYDFS